MQTYTLLKYKCFSHKDRYPPLLNLLILSDLILKNRLFFMTTQRARLSVTDSSLLAQHAVAEALA